MGLLERFWRVLPDNCEMPNCSRQGVRGNENIVDGIVMCDYCHAKVMRNERPWPNRPAHAPTGSE